MNKKTKILITAAASLVGAILLSILLIGMISGSWPWTAKSFGEYVGLKPKETTAATENTVPDETTTVGEDTPDGTENTDENTENTTPAGGGSGTEQGNKQPSVGVEVEPGDVVVPIPGTSGSGSSGSGSSGSGTSGSGTSGSGSSGGATGENIDFDALLGAAGKG